MNDIRCIFNHSGRQAEHYILAFTDEEAERFTYPNMFKLGYDICEFFENVPVFFAYHEYKDDGNAFYENSNLHMHLAVGTTNFATGKKIAPTNRKHIDSETMLKSC